MHNCRGTKTTHRLARENAAQLVDRAVDKRVFRFTHPAEFRAQMQLDHGMPMLVESVDQCVCDASPIGEDDKRRVGLICPNGARICPLLQVFFVRVQLRPG